MSLSNGTTVAIPFTRVWLREILADTHEKFKGLIALQPLDFVVQAGKGAIPDKENLGYPRDEERMQRLLRTVLKATSGCVSSGALADAANGHDDAASRSIEALVAKRQTERLHVIEQAMCHAGPISARPSVSRRNMI